MRGHLNELNTGSYVEPARPPDREKGALDAEGTAHLQEIAAGARLYVPVLLGVMTGRALARRVTAG